MCRGRTQAQAAATDTRIVRAARAAKAARRGWTAQAATRQIDVAGIAALELGDPTDVTVEGCVPGFYYTIYGGSTATNLKSFVSEKSRNVLCEPGKPVTFSGVVKPSDAAGFFSVGVKETGDVSASAE